MLSENGNVFEVDDLQKEKSMFYSVAKKRTVSTNSNFFFSFTSCSLNT